MAGRSRQVFFPAPPTPSADAFRSATRVPPARHTPSSRTASVSSCHAPPPLCAPRTAQTVTVTRNAKGRPLVWPDPDKDIGS